MRNINTDGRKTIFIDVDGTLVKHNYDPENDPEVFLEKTITYLRKHSDCCLVLVSARSFDNMQPVLDQLEARGIKIYDWICGLPTGQRIMVNDYRGDYMVEPTAVALNVPSEEGVDDTANCEFHKQWCN